MDKKGASELKRRLKKDDVTFTKVCGCYVDADRNKVVKFNKTFLNLEDDQFFKYLEIAKNVLSGKVGDHILTLDFPVAEEEKGGRQQILMALRESKLENEELLDVYYDQVIDTYDYPGNYLILLFHDVYDVMTRTSDNQKLDESEEVYEYLLCAICPVKLSKPALGYLAAENAIGPRERDWVVDAPDTGFVFPDFDDRSTNIHSVAFYTKNVKDPHSEFMCNGLGCDPKRTATEKKNAFENIVKKSFVEKEKADDAYLEVQEKIGSFIETKMKENDKDPVPLTEETVKDIIKDAGIPEEQTERITKTFKEVFADDVPEADHIYDEKLLEKTEVVRNLEHQVKELSEQMQQSDKKLNARTISLNIGAGLQVSAKIEEVNGTSCLVVAVEDADEIIVNGKSI